MTVFQSQLLDKLENLARETKLFLSSLQKDGTLAEAFLDMPRAKWFMIAFSGYISSSQTTIHRQIINMDVRSKKNELPDRNLLQREISDNLLALPTLDHIEIYKSRINEVINVVWAAKEEVSKLKEECETLLPALRKALEWWTSPANQEATLSKINSLDVGSGDISRSVQIQLNAFSSLQLAISLLESLPSNSLVTYWALLKNCLVTVSEAVSSSRNNEFKESKWVGKNNDFNNMPLNTVEGFFMQLAEEKSKDGSPFLTVEQVEQFIERAFIGNTAIPAPILNATDREKSKIVGLFHLYYEYCEKFLTGIGKIDPKVSHPRYIHLLTDNINRWTYDEIKNNFRRKEGWKKPA